MESAPPEAGLEVACSVLGPLGAMLPIRVITLGNASAGAAVGFFGGVHGLERIGSSVVTAWLASLLGRIRWDEVLAETLQRVRVVFVPIVNPGGMVRGTRANPNGVDLMRNAPVEAREPVPFLVGGQRISAGLPWYRGRADEPMEAEAAALCGVVRRELLGRKFALALDCHSGFGMRDRLWFPLAYRRTPIPHLPQLHALWSLFESGNPNHQYVCEPQSRQYLAHGDLWDFLYLQACETPERVFLPLTLEMGSWLWVRKNPRQLFSRHGIFNPQVAHRLGRVMRRHVALFDFALRAAASYDRWLPGEGAALRAHREGALSRWYGPGP